MNSLNKTIDDINKILGKDVLKLEYYKKHNKYIITYFKNRKHIILNTSDNYFAILSFTQGIKFLLKESKDKEFIDNKISIKDNEIDSIINYINSCYDKPLIKYVKVNSNYKIYKFKNNILKECGIKSEYKLMYMFCFGLITGLMINNNFIKKEKI